MKHLVITPSLLKHILINPELWLYPTPVIPIPEKNLNSSRDAMSVIRKIAISNQVFHVQAATISFTKLAAN
ncbi:MAG: hypothetical protein QF782_02815 [Porticoccaceae bacterium]|nr:hypothetical protein [Porticoccaceae bacterium]